MNAIIKKVAVPENHRIKVDVELPQDFPTSRAVLIVEPDAGDGKKVNRLGEIFGLGKGEIWMAEDFDAPLDEFEEYM